VAAQPNKVRQHALVFAVALIGIAGGSLYAVPKPAEAAMQAGTATVTPANTPTGTATIIPPTALYTPDDETSPCVGVEDPAPIITSDKTFWAKPEQVIDPTHTYCAIIKTDKGRMIAELYAADAPQNVNAFVFLAQQGYYDNLTWHRVLEDFMAQTGDPLGTGTGGPGFTSPLEVVPNLKYDKAGVIGMARTNDPNSAGSQFFITFDAAPYLDPSSQTLGYTIIGQVVEGLDVLSQIRLRDPQTSPDFEGDPLVSIRIVEMVEEE
jgi:peptidylprolyl isomerase